VRTRIWYQLKRDGFTIPFPVRVVEHESARRIVERRHAREIELARELVDQVDFLAALPPEGRQRLAERARHLHFDAGEKLVVEGEQGDSLFVIVQGSVLVSKSGTEVGTSNVMLATLGSGDFFGETSLMTGAPRSATVTAETGVEAFVFDREAMAPILHGDPKMAETLSRVLAERIAATVARFEDQLDQMRRAPAHEQRSLLGKIRSFFGLGD
jgi:CRP-like cAMP-binding protein